MASTHEKMQALAVELRQQALEDTSDEAQGFVTLVQLAAGFGIDVFEWIIPDDPADADVFLDQLLALLLRVRGDDLPPFDPDLYGEAAGDARPEGDRQPEGDQVPAGEHEHQAAELES